ncbi:hypothetical protein BIW11_09188 [Tropilaelaps mercedesae]|uniref:Uncharacterized protein n=1 Tax=Tropilaelaps mercedesae TaxID=418985 RepID=A0A1V9XLC8_9ACAR|nr:hypothetical protein BIW11_09188 [Tropilaelaps mercedesae]
MSCLEKFGLLQPFKPMVMHVYADWYTSAFKYTEELQQDARFQCAHNVRNEEEIMGYDFETKENIINLNRYFEGLEQHKKMQEKAHFSEFEHNEDLQKEADNNTLRHMLIHQKTSTYANTTGRSLRSPNDSTSADRKVLISKTGNELTGKVAKESICVSSPTTNRVQVVQENWRSMLQFSVRVEFVENYDSVVCTVPAARAAVESLLASKFFTLCVDCRLAKCTRLDHGPKLHAIDLMKVRPHQLVLVASPRGQLFRGLVQVIRDPGTRPSGIGVGFVDKPGGIFTSQVFNCPTDIGAVPYALLRLELCEKTGSQHANIDNLKELRKGDVRMVRCHAIEGTTAFGVFADLIGEKPNYQTLKRIQ